MQLHTVFCQSGRRSGQYRPLEAENPKETAVRNKTVSTGGIVPLSVSNSSSNIIKLNNKTVSSSVYKQPKKPLRVDLTKIKTLLPYLLIKRAYLKLKVGKDQRSRKDEKTVTAGKTRSRSSSNDLINKLCKKSGTSICQLVSNVMF